MRSSSVKITTQDKDAAEQEIYYQKQRIDYDTKEYPIEVLVKKYREGFDQNTNELVLSGCPSKIVWDDSTQSRFIESIILGFPIPPIFLCDIQQEADAARLLVVDGNQRVLSITKFVSNGLVLVGLSRLPLLNGFKFADLVPSRQRKFNRSTFRIIQFSTKTTEEFIEDFRDRLNINRHDF
jgi:hypothetical protein